MKERRPRSPTSDDQYSIPISKFKKEENETTILLDELEDTKSQLKQAHERIRQLEAEVALRQSHSYVMPSFNTKIFSPSFGDIMVDVEDSSLDQVSIIICGASGDIAKKKTFSALYGLFVSDMLPECKIIGFARTDMTDENFRQHVAANIEPKTKSKKSIEEFLGRVYYWKAHSYDDAESWTRLHTLLERSGINNRLFYLNVPSSLYVETSSAIKSYALSSAGWNRIAVEKPFGHDYESAVDLSNKLGAFFHEEDIYRIDHYLGKEMVQNLLVLRFANNVFEPIWNRFYIANVRITFKENFGITSRGQYFDKYGIIRDVMQNHLMQILSLFAMEPPVSLSAEDIACKKIKILQATTSPSFDTDVVIGQYIAGSTNHGYREQPQVAQDSNTETFAQVIFKVNNTRWQGVPFIISCGKGLDERKAEICIQFHEFPGFLSPTAQRNELVLQIQPNEAVTLKLMNKAPGFYTDLVCILLSLQ